MIHVIFSILASQTPPLKLRDVAYQTEARLKVVVGPRTSNPHEPGIRFARKGYYQVWIDTPGPKMKHVILDLTSRPAWKDYLAMCGLNGSHASATPQPSPASFMPLARNQLLLKGVSGLPAGVWTVTFKEFAVANHDRLRALKTQIDSSPVGEGRNQLIRSCYDWWSELDFRRT